MAENPHTPKALLSARARRCAAPSTQRSSLCFTRRSSSTMKAPGHGAKRPCKRSESEQDDQAHHAQDGAQGACLLASTGRYGYEWLTNENERMRRVGGRGCGARAGPHLRRTDLGRSVMAVVGCAPDRYDRTRGHGDAPSTSTANWQSHNACSTEVMISDLSEPPEMTRGSHVTVTLRAERLAQSRANRHAPTRPDGQHVGRWRGRNPGGTLGVGSPVPPHSKVFETPFRSEAA